MRRHALLLLATCAPAPAYAQVIPKDPTEAPTPPVAGEHDCPTGVVIDGTPVTADCDGVLVSPGDGWLLMDGWPVQYGRLRREHDGLSIELETRVWQLGVMQEQLERERAARELEVRLSRRRARETTAVVLLSLAAGVGLGLAAVEVGQ